MFEQSVVYQGLYWTYVCLKTLNIDFADESYFLQSQHFQGQQVIT